VKIQITTVAADGSGAKDVLLSASGSVTVREIAASLSGPDGGDTASLANMMGSLMGIPAPAAPPSSIGLTAPPPAPDCYLGTKLLNPDTPLSESGILEGSVVGLGAPVLAPERPYGPERHEMPLPADTLEQADHTPVVELQVVGGPEAGSAHLLGPGTHVIGPASSAAVQLAGRDMPEEGLEVTIRPDGSALVRFPAGGHAYFSRPEPPPHRGRADLAPLPDVPDDSDLEEETGPAPHEVPPGWEVWPFGAEVVLGEFLLRVVKPTERDAAVVPSEDDAGLDYNRPPRLLPHLQPERFRLLGPPTPPTKNPLPLLATLSPLLMGVVMVYFFQSWYYMAFMLLSPLMMAGNVISGRTAARKNFLEQVRQYKVRRASLEADVEEKLANERYRRMTAGTDPAVAALSAIGPGARLWERRRSDPDHLMLRIGTAAQPSLLEIDDASREDNHQSVRWTILDAPVSADIAGCGVVGIAGETGPARALARWMTTQAAIQHSPRDLRIIVLTDRSSADSWNWVRWLPHARTEGSGLISGAVTLLGNDPETVANRVAELVSSMRARTEAAGASMSRALLNEPDLLVVLDGARVLRDVPGVVQILKEGPPVRIFSLCLDTEKRLLPEECTAVIRYEDRRLTLGVTGAPDVTGIRPDLVSPAWCERAARGIAPIRDVTPDAAVGLPGKVGLLELLGLEPPSGEAIAAHWAQKPASTVLPIGAGYDGPVAFDLVRDGPHALIAGTTGSGKSELLQTFVASLAAVNRPDEMTFVLVDYKGGSAFKECVHLPHTLGMVTDLDSHLVKRALESLSAELMRRESVLARVGAKDLPEYNSMRRRDPSLAPLARLILVIDEFATLVKEVPDFVPGLVSIAQRGRSLGLHLVLATQRPAGAVSADIRANTNLRICLRVTDAPDSMDVIDTKDAVTISPTTPGRALARLGQGSVLPFQTAFAGTPRPAEEIEGGVLPDPAAQAAAEPGVWAAELPWQRLGRAADVPNSEATSASDPDDLPTDLNALVKAVSEAAQLTGCEPQPRPWLPPLNQRVLLDELPQFGAPGPGRLAPVPWGLSDVPIAQAQIPVVLDLAEFKHLYVIGVPRSGRSQVLRTMAGALARTHSVADLHLYGIDFGGGALAAVNALPHCGAIAARGDEERLDRLLTRLGRELSMRQTMLTQKHASSLTELRGMAGTSQRPAHIMLLIDGWDAMVETISDREGGRIMEELVRLLREGSAAGIHIVATSERALLTSRMQTLNENLLLLRMNDPAEYTYVGLRRGEVPAEIPAGRGWATGGQELQVALLALGESGQEQAEALRQIGVEAGRRATDVPADRKPFRVDTLPVRIPFMQVFDRVPKELRRPMWGLLGLGGDDLAPIGVDFASSPSFLIAGPPGSGRSTALASLAVSLLAGGTRLLILAPRDSPLRLLAPHPGVTLMTELNPAPDVFDAALKRLPAPAVVLIDDGDLLGFMPAADQSLRTLAISGRDRGLGLAAAFTAETAGNAAIGWISEIRRHRKGVVISPMNLLEGDLLGVRLTHSQLRGRLPGRGLTLDPKTGALIIVQIPDTTQDLGG